MRLLCVMGSGETSPTMVKTHRGLLERVGEPAVVLDTPFGFQENAGELTAKAIDYFRESVGRDLGVASYRSAAAATTVELETMLDRVRRARYVFAGPGSPSYALRQWKGTPVHDLLADKLRVGGSGGAVVFASAAALTLGRFTIPVYEIYKVGADTEWLDGLDLVAEAGLDCAVVPHWNNAEGGTHDTRYCYMGERRLQLLEDRLPPSTFVLGVDEHTGCILDLDARTVTVVGNGAVHVRRHGSTTTFPSGTTVAFDDLVSATPSRTLNGLQRPAQQTVQSSTGSAQSPLLDEVARLEGAASDAVEQRDAQAFTDAALELEATINEWSTETFSGDEMERARRALRALIVRLGEAATGGLRDQRDVVAPYVDALLAARVDLRAASQYDAADALRDRLLAVGIEVRDTPDGTTWDLRE